MWLSEVFGFFSPSHPHETPIQQTLLGSLLSPGREREGIQLVRGVPGSFAAGARAASRTVSPTLGN